MCWCAGATGTSPAAVADNRTARISENGFHRLVKRAEEDGILAEKVGLRPDIPAPMFRELLIKVTSGGHKRLIASATPELRTAICDVLAKVSQEVGARVGPRDYRPAQRTILSLDRARRLDEPTLAAFCKEGRYEEVVVALATLSKVPIKIADRLMGSDRPDPVLILCKAANLNWSTVKALIMARGEGAGTCRIRWTWRTRSTGGSRPRPRSAWCGSAGSAELNLTLHP